MAFFERRRKKKYDLSDVLEDNDFIMDFGESPADSPLNSTKIKPSHALTARELLNQEAPAEEIPMQGGTSAAEALRSRMQHQPTEPPVQAEKIPMQPEKAEEKKENLPPETADSDFEQLISRLQALVKDIGAERETADDVQTLTHNDIEDIISLAEQRARQRAQAVYNRRTVLPAENYPFYNPLAEPEDLAETAVEPEDTPEVLPQAESEPKPVIEAPQIHLAADPSAEMPEAADLHATQPFSIAEEVSLSEEDTLFSTRVLPDLPSQSVEEDFSDFEPFVAEDTDLDKPEEPQEPEEEYPGDYTCIDDAPQMKLQLAHSIKKLSLRTAVCGVCSFLFLLLSGALFLDLDLPSFTLNIVQLVLLLICGLAGSNILRGIVSIFKGISDADSIAAVAFFFTLAHNIYFGFVAGQAPVFQPEAAIAVSLTLFNYGKLVNARRIYKNFCRIATTNEKHALHFIEKDSSVHSIVRGALDGPALICTGRRTTNLNGFFKNTYSCDVQSSVNGRLLVISAVVALLMGVLGFTQMNADFAFTAMALSLSIFAAPATVLVSVWPLKAAADTLEEYHSVLPGYSSAFKIRSANALAVDLADLFPKGNVKLYNMHTLSKNPVDRSLCEAAAVVMAAKSPLRDIFAQITGSLKENLPAVDSMLYEERLGLSGWVDDRRILIGNRTLMENHNVPIPSYEVDKKILSKGFFPVYIAADSKPCVLLVVGYNADETVTYELRRVCNAGYTVMVNGCDPNTSGEMLCDYFGLPEGSVKVMNADGVRAYKEETNYQESLESVASYDHSVCGLFALATASMRVPVLSLWMVVLNIISIAVGISALGCMLFMGTTPLLTPLIFLLYQLVSTLVIRLISLLFKP
ncbi:MAG: hypothetical protein IJW78_03690 [Clostridia bacterium]|nr:hypothetical protein [Clostridia bacterium]